MNEHLVANVTSQVDKDPKVSVYEIRSDSHASISSVHKVLHNKLGLRKFSARWVPLMLITEQKSNRVNCARQLLDIFKPN